MDNIKHNEDTSLRDFSHINGWGADLDHSNRPAYPMERTPPRLEVVPKPPEQQLETVKILRSNERSEITPIFGTTVPPSGISGKLREYAFKYSENDLRHWMLLLFADRINMFEGLASDLKRGHMPNLIAETGLRSEFRYNRANAIQKTATAVFLLGIGIYLLMRRKPR